MAITNNIPMPPGYLANSSPAAVVAYSNPQYGITHVGLSAYKPDALLKIHDSQQNEIVRIKNDGTVEWHNGINIDEAAIALAKGMTMSAEIKAGLTHAKQLEIRNQLFDDIIQTAEEEGPLDAKTLRFMLRSCKIMDKLRDNI